MKKKIIQLTPQRLKTSATITNSISSAPAAKKTKAVLLIFGLENCLSQVLLVRKKED